MTATIYRKCFKCEKLIPENDILTCKVCQQELCADCIDSENSDSNGAYCDGCFSSKEQFEEDKKYKTDEEFFEDR